MSDVPPITPDPLAPRPSRLITPQQLGDRIGRTRDAIYAMHYRGGIPGAVKLGRSLRFHEHVIDAWIASGTLAPDADLPSTKVEVGS